MAVQVEGFIGTVRPGRLVACRFRTLDGEGPATWASGLVIVERGDGQRTEAGVSLVTDRRPNLDAEVGANMVFVDTGYDPFYRADEAYLLFLYGDEVGGEPVNGVLAGSFRIDTEAP